MLKLKKKSNRLNAGKILNGVQKPSNRALNIGKNTRAPIMTMEGIFRGVRSEGLSTQRVKSSLSSRPIMAHFGEDWLHF